MTAYLINRHQVDPMIDGEFLIVSPMDSDELNIPVVHRCGACLRIPRPSRAHQSAPITGKENCKYQRTPSVLERLHQSTFGSVILI